MVLPFLLSSDAAGSELAGPELHELLTRLRRWWMYHARRQPLSAEKGYGTAEGNKEAAAEMLDAAKSLQQVKHCSVTIACPNLPALVAPSPAPPASFAKQSYHLPIVHPGAARDGHNDDLQPPLLQLRHPTAGVYVRLRFRAERLLGGGRRPGR